jgi:hypothetical protein
LLLSNEDVELEQRKPDLEVEKKIGKQLFQQIDFAGPLAQPDGIKQ